MTRSAPSNPRILVFVKRLHEDVAEAADQQVLGQCEQSALAAAVTLAEEANATVSAIAVGSPAHENRVLATALRAGCSRAIRAYDESLEHVDYLGIARVLAAAASHAGFDLILCGDRSQEEQRGAIGPAVAELLAIPHISGVIDLRFGTGGLVITRRTTGQLETLRAQLPILCTVARFARRTRAAPEGSPHGDGESAKARDTIPAISALDLPTIGIDPRELKYRARFVGSSHPAQGRGRGQATILRNARDLIQRLRDDRLLE